MRVEFYCTLRHARGVYGTFEKSLVTEIVPLPGMDISISPFGAELRRDDWSVTAIYEDDDESSHYYFVQIRKNLEDEENCRAIGFGLEKTGWKVATKIGDD